jgi:hypothetical protein
MDRRVGGRVGGWMEGRMDRRIAGWLGGQMNVLQNKLIDASAEGKIVGLQSYALSKGQSIPHLIFTRGESREKCPWKKLLVAECIWHLVASARCTE